jgi:hypothetical protein
VTFNIFGIHFIALIKGILHRPKLILFSCTMGGVGGGSRIFMKGQGEIANDEP